MITRGQIRAARALLGWKQTDLANAAGVSEMSVKNIESETTKKDFRISTLESIRGALEDAGIQFVNIEKGEGVIKLKPRGDNGQAA